MKIIVVVALSAAAIVSLGAPGKVRAEKPRRYVPANLSLISPVELFPFERKAVVGVSVNLLYGKSAAVYGFEVGGLMNHETEAFGGLQLAGLANWVAGDVTGVQLSGAVNWVKGDCSAFQVSSVNYCARGGALQVGLFNAGGNGLSAMQLGAFGNVIDSAPFAIQIAPFINNVVKDFRGFQLGFWNLNGQTVPVKTGSCGHNCDVMSTTRYPDARSVGVSIGVANGAQHMRGVQIGLLNTARDLKGVQVGALFNLSGDVSGLQIGLINVARRLRGVQLGLLNVAYKNPLPVFVGINAGF
jgi:hypothetical protein